MKRFLSLLLALMMVLSLVACGSDGADAGSEEDVATNDETSGVSADALLTKCDISMYGEIQDTNYISVVLYDGNSAESTYSKSVVAVYDIKENLYDTQMLSDDFMKVVNTNNWIYNFSLGTEHTAFKSLIKARKEDNCVVDVGSSLEEDQGYIRETAVMNTFISLLDTDYAADSDIYSGEILTDDYYVGYYDFDTVVRYIEVKIGEISGTNPKNMYICMPLLTPIPIDGNEGAAIEKAYQEGAFATTVYVLGDMNDLNSVEKVIGPDIGLENTTFLQDILAQKFSNIYGLNLRDKSVNIHWDNTYIDVKTEEATARFNWFEGKGEYIVGEYDLSYEYVRALAEKNDYERFNYTDDEGVTYDYIRNGEVDGVCVYRDKTLVNIILTNAVGDFPSISALFGIK